MRTRINFTDAEDMAIWKVAIEQQKTGFLGKVFRDRMRSKRTTASLYYRFKNVLLERLQNTGFHSETKLKLCEKYKVSVAESFLEELEMDADVQVDNHGVVTSFRMKDTCEKNEDMELSDEEFMKISTVNEMKKKKFTPREVAQIWEYVIEHHETFTRGRKKFWKGLSKKLNRPCLGLLRKFMDSLLPKLHTMNFPVEDSLKLYKCCQVPVDKEYLEELNKHAVLKIDKNRRIIRYKLENGRPEKRKNTEETDRRAKKAREAGGREDEEMTEGELSGNESEEEDLILNNVIPETGQPDDYQQYDDIVDFPEHVVPAFLKQPKAEMFEAEGYPEQVVSSQCASMGMMTEMIQKVKEKMDRQEENMKMNVAEMKEELKVAMKTGAEQQSEELKRDLESTLDTMISERFKKHEAVIEAMIMRVMAKGLDEMKNIRKSEDDTSSIRKKCLLNLKKLISSFESPETAEVEQKIDTEVQNLLEDDERPLPPEMLPAVILTANRFIDRLV